MAPGKLAPGKLENHDGPSGRERVLRTIAACSQRCAFCFVDLTGKPVPTAALEGELASLAAAPGPKPALIFSGGEPTLDPRLPRLLEKARALGFSDLAIQTNGVLLGRPGFLKSLVDQGLTRWRVSFHSHKPDVYNKITGSRDQYPQAVAGLKALLAEARARVSFHVVVNKLNFQTLPELAEFFVTLARKRPASACFTMINEYGHEKTPGWAVDLARAAPPLCRAVEIARQAGLAIEDLASDTAFPPCILEPKTRTREAFPAPRARYADDFSGPEGLTGRAKRRGCRSCAYDAECFGVPARYARLFGLGALLPVPFRK